MERHPPDLLSVEDIAAALRVTTAAVRRLLLLKQLPGRKIGRRWWCLRSDFERFVRGELS